MGTSEALNSDEINIRFNASDVRIFLAAAGTGKTTMAVNEIIRLLDFYLPSEVAYTTFTKKGVQEGLNAVLQRAKGVKKSDLYNFFTIHSLCFKHSGISADSLFTKKHLMNFNKCTGFHLSGTDEFDSRTKDDVLYGLYNLIRAGKTTIRLINVDVARLRKFQILYEQFKKEYQLYDFQDCLDMYLQLGDPIPCKVGIIDEAQDLTPSQWLVCEKAFGKCKVIKCFGDDYQSIYTHSGASPRIFIQLAKDYATTELGISYRVPYAVYEASKMITRYLSEKVDKDFVPVDQKRKGFVNYDVPLNIVVHRIFEDIQKNGLQSKRFMCLFRTNIHIKTISSRLRDAGILYHTNDGFCIHSRKLAKVLKVLDYRKIQDECQEEIITFKNANGIESLESSFTEMGFLSYEESVYIEKVLCRYSVEEVKKAKENRHILLSTIHKAKGGEADIVFLSTDATRRVHVNLVENIDEELRILYVAMTRARVGVHILQPTTKWNLTQMINLTR